MSRELSGASSVCGLAHPRTVRMQRYRLRLDAGFNKALVKKILSASGDMQADQGENVFAGMLLMSSGLVQPWSVFSVIKTPLNR